MSGEFQPGAPVRNHDLDERLKRAYATAMDQQHQRLPGRIEIHMGKDVIEYLRSLAYVPDPVANRRTCWGFPVVQTPDAWPDHLSVHTVQAIP